MTAGQNMAHNMTMLVVNIFEAKAKLSEYLEIAARGERVVIAKRNRPVAELRAIEPVRSEPRPIGLGQKTVVVPPSFFEPLPDDVIEEFEGGGRPNAAASRVADAPASYGEASPSKGRGRRRR